MVTTTIEAGSKRWEGVSKAERAVIAREAVNARWDQWRAENPEKAAASEERRAKRAGMALKAGRKKTVVKKTGVKKAAKKAGKAGTILVAKAIRFKAAATPASRLRASAPADSHWAEQKHRS